MTVAAVCVAAGISGCGDGDGGGAGESPALPEAMRSPATPRTDSTSVRPLEPPRCPPEAANCAVATGTVLTLERVDPDGDGDAHFILLSRESITAPGIAVIDVARELRPQPLPEPGDQVAAAGPVYRGSYGQRQIQATALRVRRR